MIDSFKFPVVLTEKTSRLMEENKYSFQVNLKLSKKEIKSFIENHYQVKVIRINTHRPPRSKGLPCYKRAIVTLEKTLTF